MKLISAILPFFLVAVSVSKSVETPDNIENSIVETLDKIVQNIITVTEDLKKYIEDEAFSSWIQAEIAAERIESLHKKYDVCVSSKDENFTTTIDKMNKSMSNCAAEAAQSSDVFIADIHAASHQLLFKGYVLLRTCQKCYESHSEKLKDDCISSVSVMATDYLEKAPESIKTIDQIISKRIPAVKAGAHKCTHDAANVAIRELNIIHNNISKCIIEGE